jgi:eukaryotic-like serine/threonine-protein kinase
VTAPFDRLKSALGDRYDLERPIGEGGMATVYLARDMKHERRVAIKVLRPELSASLGADRFLREIRVAANLQHPNILGLYDSGELDGLLYYVMPFVEGESLRDRLNREQQLPIHDALQIAREAAEALDYAHKHGIVHRDIKPENILLQGGHALVADFGIARAFSQAGGEKLTQTGMAVGTPAYMSPEQSHGSDHVDARSDVYSLGCVLYELLIGQPPFTGPNAMAIMARHSMEVVPSLQVVRQSVPDSVEDAVLRALEKTPADRFQTMAEFCDCLAQAEAESTVARTAARRAATGAARRVGTREVAAAQAARAGKRRALIIAAAFGLLLAAGGAFAALRNREARAMPSKNDGGLDAHRVAVLYFQDPSSSDSLRYLADGLTEGLIRQLASVQTLDVISANGVAPYRSDSVAPDSVARALGVGTLVRGSVEKSTGRIRVSVRLVDGASGVDYQRASLELPASNVLGVQDSLVQEVAGLIRQRLGEEIKVREQREGTGSASAWALVQRAEQSRKRAEASFSKAESTAVVERSFDQADSLYVRAQAADSHWVEPIIGRASVAYRRSRLAVADPLVAKQWIDRGTKLADEALVLSPDNPDALEVRGTLRYWGWLLGVEPDPGAARKLLADARTDLETAVRLRPSQAGAWAILSHLYNVVGGETDAKLAARRAYEEDAYLSNADQVLSRLFLASYDLGQLVDAVHWCDEGHRRFPADFKFLSCQLWLMTSKAKDPDPKLAWMLADSASKLAPAPDREFESRKARLGVAAVLARKSASDRTLADSARRVAERARGNGEVDPTRDLAYIEAFVRTLLNDREEAVRLLKQYVAANPDRRADLADESGWWFRGLLDYPQFQELVRAK